MPPLATGPQSGDGAVGLCAVIAARHMGAARIIAMSRHEPR
jgi:threonine dehydrogenase-like Zn-dependent dehydrogenase